MNQFLKTKFLILVLFMQCYFSFAQAGMEVNYNVNIDNPQQVKNEANQLVDNPYDFTRLKSYKLANPVSFDKGFLDVSLAPYWVTGHISKTADYNTTNIQNAIDDALEGNLVVFFPGNRTYIVNKQLRCIRKNAKDSRKDGVQLLGSKLGTKPVIQLVDGSNFGSTGNAKDKTLLFFDSVLPTLIGDSYTPVPNPDGTYNYSSDASRHYGSQLRGIIIDMGNNSNNNAISMNGAQYCSIEDVEIKGASFNAGIIALPGSGGFTANVSITGGNYGIYQTDYRPNPTITGLTLDNQSTAGIYLGLTRGPLVVTGFNIKSPNPAPAGYKGIQIVGGTINSNVQGALCLTDGSIEIMGSNATLIAVDNSSQHSLTIKNLFVKAGIAVKSSTTHILNGTISNWKQMASYNFSGTTDAGSVYKDFTTQKTAQGALYQQNSSLIDAVSGVPTDLVSKHIWVTSAMPSWQDTNVIDISKAPYNATPENINATDDDQDNIQSAIDFAVANNKTVFIPRGHFHIGSTLNFPSGLKIIGASKSISVIQPLTNVDFNPVIQSGNSASGSLIMSDFGVLTVPYHTMLQIQTNNTIIRDVLTEIDAKSKSCYSTSNCPYITFVARPYYLFSGGAGGKIFGLCADQLVVPMGNPSSKKVVDYNLLKVTSTQPLEYHQLSIEHLDNSPQVQFNGAANTAVYGLKIEGHFELLNILNSNNVSIIGGSGNYGLEDTTNSRGIIFIDNSSTSVLIQNLVRKSWGTDVATNWIKGVEASKTVPSSYPVLSFTIGTPSNARMAKDTKIVATGSIPYINPLTKELTIENLVNNETIEIYSMLGNRVIQTRNVNGSVARINISDLSTGVYIVTVNNQATKFLKNF